MATYQIDGTTAVTASSTRNNAGTIRQGGTIASTKWDSDALGEQLYGGGVNDTSSANPSVRTAVKLFSAGNFAKLVKQKYVIRRITTELAGASGHTRLKSGGASFGIRDSIHARHTVSTVFTATAIVAGKWNIYTGRWAAGYPATDTTDHFYNIAGTKTATNDDASTPTRSIPGELVYRTGKKKATQADYEAKTG